MKKQFIIGLLALIARMTLAAAPNITEQPTPVYTDEGDLVIFSVAATAASGTVSYAWMKDSVPLTDDEFITGSTYSRLVISPVRVADAGEYTVTVSDAAGSITSAGATLTLGLPLPSITAQPNDSTTTSGASVSFTINTLDADTIQWYHGENLMLDETNSTLQLLSASQSDNGVYSARLSNNRGSIFSRPVRLTVTASSALNTALDINTVAITTADGWNNQSITTHDGTDAAQSASITHSQISVMNAALFGPGDYSFFWYVSSEYTDYLSYSIDGISQGGSIAGTTEVWGQRSGFISENLHDMQWTYDKDYAVSQGSDAAWVDQLVFTPYGLSSVEQAVDNLPGPIILGGAGKWYGQDNETYDGTNAVRAPRIGHDDSAWFETTVNGPGQVTFWVKTSSEYTDDMNYSVDGISQYSLANTNDWTAVTNWIEWGTHTLRWSYDKDYDISLHDDTVWLDQISYTPVRLSSLADASDSSELSWTTCSNAPWFGQDRFTHDGTDALQSGPISHDGSTWVKATGEGPGTLTFNLKTSSEYTDLVRFYINEVEKQSRGNITDWAESSYTITNTGPIELKWEYTKDYSVDTGEDAVWIDQVIFTPQRDPVTFTVASPLGSPSPSVGVTTNDWGTSVTCSVANVQAGLTQYECTGWTGSGSIPASGSTNLMVVKLEENSSILWNWQTNYWLDVTAGTGGSLSHADGFYQADSDQTIVATPASGYLFMYWGGDASGTNLSTIVAMSSSKSITATFSNDADNDGLTNNEEAGLGTNPRKADTDDDGFDDKLEVDNGGSPTVSDEWRVDYIRDNGGDFNLYSSNVVLDVAIGEMLLDVVGTEATLSLQLETSDDLQSWTNAGPVKVWNWTVDGDQKFFRVKSDK